MSFATRFWGSVARFLQTPKSSSSDGGVSEERHAEEDTLRLINEKLALAEKALEALHEKHGDKIHPLRHKMEELKKQLEEKTRGPSP